MGKGNEGVILTSTLWNQSGTIYISIDGQQTALTGYTYNQYCPWIPDSTTTHSVTGCSNTADSQILYYYLEQGYNFNLSVSASDSYRWKGDSKQHYLSEDPTMGEGSISEINALLSGDLRTKLDDGDFIAALNFYCGAKNNSQYGASTSTSWSYGVSYTGKNAAVFKAAGFDSYFFIDTNATSGNHPTSKLYFNTDKLTDLGYSVIRENLDYGEIIRVGIPGHAIYMDGYRYNEQTQQYEYHLNYGWGTKSSSTNWYTTSQLDDLELKYIMIDLSPDIKVEVSNSSGEYCGGSFMRGVERINHIQNEKTTTFSFSDDIAGETITVNSSVVFSSNVDLEFKNFCVDFVSTLSCGIQSAPKADYGLKKLDFDLIQGSISVNNDSTDPIGISGGILDVDLNNSWLYAGYWNSDFSIISQTIKNAGSIELSDFSTSFLNSAKGTAMEGGSGDDTLTLSNASAVFGAVDLGSGENTITIDNGSMLYGTILAAAGSVELNLLINDSDNRNALIIADSSDMENSLYSATGGRIHVDFDKGLTGSYTLIDGYTNSVMDNFTVEVAWQDTVATLSASQLESGYFTLSFTDGDMILTFSQNDQIKLYRNGTLLSSSRVMNTTMDSGETMHVSSGGSATAVMRSGAEAYVSAGGLASACKIYNRSYLNLLDAAAKLENTEIFSGGTVIADGGIISDTIISGGAMHVRSSDTQVTDTAINYGGAMYVSDGSISATAINSGGSMHVSGGDIENTRINYGGTMTLSKGSAENTTVLQGGVMQISHQGSAGNTAVSSGGKLIINSGASAGQLTASQGAVLEINVTSNTSIDGISCDTAFSMKNAVLSDLVLDSGTVNVKSSASAVNTVLNAGSMRVSSGGSVSGTTVNNGGLMLLSSGGTAYDTRLNAGGEMRLSSGSIHSGTLYINSDAVVSASKGAVIDFSLRGRTGKDAFLCNDLSRISGSVTYTVSVDGKQANGTYKLAQNADLSGTAITVNCGTAVCGTLTVNGSILRYKDKDYKLSCESGSLYFKISDNDFTAPEAPEVSASTTDMTGQDVIVTAQFSSDSFLKEYSLDGKNWLEYTGEITFTANGSVSFRSTDDAGNISEITQYTVSNIDKYAPSKPAGLTEFYNGTAMSISWSTSVDSGVSGLAGYRIRYAANSKLNGNGTFVAANSIQLDDLSLGTWYYQVQAVDSAGNCSAWTDIRSFTITTVPIKNIQVTSSGIQWDSVGTAEKYILQLSADNFEHCFTIETTTSQIDISGLRGNYQTRLSLDGQNWQQGPNLTGTLADKPAKMISDSDGNTDVFLAKSFSCWEPDFCAQHTGFRNGWQGTSEIVLLDGKNKITDIFGGTKDANVLLLSDDSNGDALFLEDIFSTQNTGTRLANIKEIYAGAGDDIIDLSSQRYLYSGDKMTVCGGAGDDTIWASKGKNVLFGDAGDDRIIGGYNNDVIIGGSGNDSLHGGGGNDTFCFGGNWGNDTVEQLENGKITLVIENGSLSCWDEETLTYSDGNNSIRVSGSAQDITLKFSADASLPDGVFADFVSAKVFEDQKKDMLA